MVNRSVSILSSSDEPAWQAYVNSHPDATIYHTLEWRDILYKGFRYQPYYLTAKSEDEITGLLPLFLVKNLTGNKLISLPFSIYGGALFDSALELQALANFAKSLIPETNSEYLLLRSFHAFEKDIADKTGLCESEAYMNFVVRLNRDPEMLWQKIKNRKEIRKAERSGLIATVSSVSSDTSDMEDFYRLQLMTRKRHGLPTPRRRYYESFLKGQTNIVMVRKDGKAIAAGLFFLFRDAILYVFGASDSRYQEYRPNDLMMWKMMRWGCMKGYKELNLGKAFAYDNGLIMFKKKWGAEVFQSPDYFFPPDAGPKVSLIQRPNLRTGSICFQHLPLCLARYIGHPVIKYLG